jgi:hypothetical protein
VVNFGLLTANTFNLGDQIQSIAARELMPKVDYLIERDRLLSYSGLPSFRMILNGWFMHASDQWPPPQNITPLFVSFHATTFKNGLMALAEKILWNVGRRQDLLDLKFSEYYRKYAPIGCRDISTSQRFEKNSIDSYFSGCLTLTLNRDRFSSSARSGVLIVDPLSDLPGRNWRERLLVRLPGSISKGVKRLSHITFSRNCLSKLKLAEELLQAYASAELVVTSRLHVVFPCLAFGTPVILIDTQRQPERYSGYQHLITSVFADKLQDAQSWEAAYVDAQRSRQPEVSKLVSRMLGEVQDFVA